MYRSRMKTRRSLSQQHLQSWLIRLRTPVLTGLLTSVALVMMTHEVAGDVECVSVSQTIEFPEVVSIGAGFSEQTSVASGWDSLFLFTTVGEINRITFEFSSTDPDYAVGPTGGVSGVEIGVVSEDASSTRTSLSSVNLGSPNVILFPGQGGCGAPASPECFRVVESLILDGQITTSLRAFEAFPTFTAGLTLDEPSFLTITVEGCIDFVEVDIDIKPGSDPNSINLGSKGNVPVAILSSDTFDATTIDPTKLTLAGAHTKIRGKKGKAAASAEDVNGDGLLDLVVKIDTSQLALSEGDTEAKLLAQTFSGQAIQGSDSVRIVP